MDYQICFQQILRGERDAVRCYRPRAAIKVEDQFAAIYVQPTQVPPAATFCGAIGSGWPPIEPDPGLRALVDRWLGQHPQHEATALGQF